MSDKKLFSYSRERFDVKANIATARASRATRGILYRGVLAISTEYMAQPHDLVLLGFYTGEHSLHRYFS